MARRSPLNPIIAIIGATGTGKSDLAVQLARRYNGEVINGDAMQLYAGLPIITNKISPREQQGVPHHLLGCIGLNERTWVVGTFVKKALSVIAEIRSRGKLPILVGGTHYYTQSLLFHDGLADHEDEHHTQDRQQWPIFQESTERLLAELERVDPVMADRWHPKDRRKIARSLEIYLKTGRRASDVYAEQREQKTAAIDGDNADKPGMRFDTLLFWVHAEQDVLRLRLDKRVEKMVDAGLLEEVDALNNHAEAEAQAGREVDETRGIWVSIGYKEFKDYVQHLQSGNCVEKELERLGVQALGKTQNATRQYAKRQLQWIRTKLVNALQAASASDRLYLLDGSDADNFTSAVVEPAADLVESWLEARPMPPPTSLSRVAAEQLQPRQDDVSTRREFTKQYCAACDVTCVVQGQWEQHTRSKRHKQAVSKTRDQG
ncbi:tRNA dimethylallyltransferase, mitochondrial [Teratosphaeria destructans]|uniref:tRNA dimethylallyltransferase n=1 Tax=Teratosphaeria destructans TaxID=418781 RepID=A0A9W7W6Y3_9PEZI|nr:tRNA dimethylallyltransferase, mitochondrial [Teratosphaeria destructans]